MADNDPRFTNQMVDAFRNARREVPTSGPGVVPETGNADYRSVKISPPSLSNGPRVIDRFGQNALEAFRNGKNFGQAFRGPPGIGISEPNFELVGQPYGPNGPSAPRFPVAGLLEPPRNPVAGTNFVMENYSNPRPNFTMVQEPAPATGSGVPQYPGNGKFMGIDMGRSLVNMNDPDMRMARGVMQTGMGLVRRNPMGVVSGLSQIAPALKDMLGGTTATALNTGIQQQNMQDIAPGTDPAMALGSRTYHTNMGPEYTAPTPASSPEQRQGYLTGSFSDAFKQARAAAGGGQGQFDWMGPNGQVRQYQTNIAGEKYIPSDRQRNITSQIAPTLSAAMQNQQAAPSRAAATTPAASSQNMPPPGTPAYNAADRQYQRYVADVQRDFVRGGASQEVGKPYPGGVPEEVRAPAVLGGTGDRPLSEQRGYTVNVIRPSEPAKILYSGYTGEKMGSIGYIPGTQTLTPFGSTLAKTVQGNIERANTKAGMRPEKQAEIQGRKADVFGQAILSMEDQLNGAIQKGSSETEIAKIKARLKTFQDARTQALENLSKRPPAESILDYLPKPEGP